MNFSGRSHGVFKFKERSLYHFASNAKPFDTLTQWNLGFYHCYISSRICLLNERKFLNYHKICSVRNGFCINNNLPMN